MNKWIKYSSIVLGVVGFGYGALWTRFFYGTLDERYLTEILREYRYQPADTQGLHHFPTDEKEVPFRMHILTGQQHTLNFPEGIDFSTLITMIAVGKVFHNLTRQEYYLVPDSISAKYQKVEKYRVHEERDQPFNFPAYTDEDFLDHPTCNFLGKYVCSPVEETVVLMFDHNIPPIIREIPFTVE